MLVVFQLEVVDNRDALLEAARGLRLERERQKELATQRANEVELMQELQETSARLTQQLTELRAASKGTTPEGPVYRIVSYIFIQKPKVHSMKFAIIWYNFNNRIGEKSGRRG